MKQTIIATYDNANDANLIIQGLNQAGIKNEEIGVMQMDRSGDIRNEEHSKDDVYGAGDKAKDVAKDTAGGAVGGGVVGSVVGLLTGIAALSIPGIGPIFATGPLAAALGLTGVAATTVTGATTGGTIGAIGGFVTGLIEMGVNEQDANDIEKHLKRGGILISVDVDENNENEIMRILQSAPSQKLIRVNNSIN